jgi:hypothetical protein
MRIEPAADAALTVEFESVEELRAEERANLAFGGLLVRTAARFAALAKIDLTLRLAGGGETTVRAQVVATPPGALALHLEADPGAIVAALLAAPDGEPDEDASGTLWETLRGLTPPQKILLAPKADRMTRAILVQESDPQVLFALLRNPRLSLDEVIRIAKSSFLSFQAAELILKTSPWFSNLDVRLALIHNAKVPLPFALRILPTLPDAEVRRIAKGAATSMALKQAALRRVTGA